MRLPERNVSASLNAVSSGTPRMSVAMGFETIAARATFGHLQQYWHASVGKIQRRRTLDKLKSQPPNNGRQEC